MKEILFIFLIFPAFCVSSQEEDRKPFFDDNSAFRFGLEVVAFKGLELRQKNGQKILKSKPLPSMIINIDFPFIKTNRWLVSIGSSIGSSPVNLSYKTDNLKNHTVYYNDGEQYDLELNEFEAIYLGTGYINLNLSVLKYINIYKKTQLIVGGGLSLFRGFRDFSEGGSFGLDEISPDNESPSYKIFEAFIDPDTNSLPWKPSIHLKVGKSLGDRIEMFINFNYSLKPWFSGTYYFYNLGYSSNGNYRKNFSNIGLEIIYSLPLKLRKI